MYVKHYDLKQKPFGAVPDPRFLWLTQEQRRETALLRHALLAQSGFALITGDVGTGKTILTKGLAESIMKDAAVVYVPDPEMEKLDFFNFIADGLGFGQCFESKADFLICLKRRLRRADAGSRKVILVIDEAHRFNHDTLQEIRLLSNIETGGRMQLSTLLVGLPEVEDLLRVEENRNVMQRITSSIRLAPLTAESTRRYVIYRLRKAGATRGIFTGPALERIHSCTGGNPRLINLLCDHALVTGYEADEKTIESRIVHECVRELGISISSATADSGNEEIAPQASPEAQEAESIETGSAKKSIFSRHRPRMRNFAVSLATVLLICIPGYFLVDRLFHPPSPKKGNEKAVREMVHIPESQPQGQDPAVFSEREFGHEMGEAPDFRDPIEEQDE